MIIVYYYYYAYVVSLVGRHVYVVPPTIHARQIVQEAGENQYACIHSRASQRSGLCIRLCTKEELLSKINLCIQCMHILSLIEC